jgi:hypothetical protein
MPVLIFLPEFAKTFALKNIAPSIFQYVDTGATACSSQAYQTLHRLCIAQSKIDHLLANAQCFAALIAGRRRVLDYWYGLRIGHFVKP